MKEQTDGQNPLDPDKRGPAQDITARSRLGGANRPQDRVRRFRKYLKTRFIKIFQTVVAPWHQDVHAWSFL
jgi:hypothetical protein